MTSTRSKIDWNSVRERLAQYQAQFDDAGRVDRNRLYEVFRQRAERLARRGRREAAQTKTTPIIAFRLGNERFGVELAHVKQVFRCVPITPIPGAGGVLLGAANLNGALRSVVDPGALLSLSAARPDAGYVVLLQAGGKLLGMWVETLEGVCPIDLDALTAVDEVASEWGSGLMSGMTDDHLVVLDAELLVERVAELRRQVSEH